MAILRTGAPPVHAAGPAPRAKKRQAARPAKAKGRAPVLSRRRVGWLAAGITAAAGVSIPLLSLALSHSAGKLAGAGHYGLALAALGLCVAVLSVSLPHLAWAVADITRSDRRASWALAVAVDLTLVFCEAAGVRAGGVIAPWLLWGTMGSVTLASMALNCWAFLRHPPAEG